MTDIDQTCASARHRPLHPGLHGPPALPTVHRLHHKREPDPTFGELHRATVTDDGVPGPAARLPAPWHHHCGCTPTTARWPSTTTTLRAGAPADALAAFCAYSHQEAPSTWTPCPTSLGTPWSDHAARGGRHPAQHLSFPGSQVNALDHSGRPYLGAQPLISCSSPFKDAETKGPSRLRRVCMMCSSGYLGPALRGKTRRTLLLWPPRSTDGEPPLVGRSRRILGPMMMGAASATGGVGAGLAGLASGGRAC